MKSSIHLISDANNQWDFQGAHASVQLPSNLGVSLGPLSGSVEHSSFAFPGLLERSQLESDWVEIDAWG